MILRAPADGRTPAYDRGGQVRGGAWVTEIVGLLDPQDWPAGMRVVTKGAASAGPGPGKSPSHSPGCRPAIRLTRPDHPLDAEGATPGQWNPRLAGPDHPICARTGRRAQAPATIPVSMVAHRYFSARGARRRQIRRAKKLGCQLKSAN